MSYSALSMRPVGSPLVLRVLWCTHGSYDLEAYLHRVLAERRVYGEWFALGPDPAAIMAQTLDRLAAGSA